MSSASGRTRGERVARISPGDDTVVQPGRPLVAVIVHPEQLKGPRARTRIRPGAAMTRRGVMTECAVVVGFVVSKRELAVAVYPSDEQWTSGTDGPAIEVTVTRLQALQPTLVVMEATGGYEGPVAAACAAAQLPVAIINPRQVRAFAQALGRTAKTDAIDAQVLALFGARVQPAPRPLPTAETDSLAELVTRRRQLLEMLGAEQRRL